MFVGGWVVGLVWLGVGGAERRGRRVGERLFFQLRVCKREKEAVKRDTASWISRQRLCVCVSVTDIRCVCTYVCV